VVVYGVLFLDWNMDTSEHGEQPFAGVRSYLYNPPTFANDTSGSQMVLGYDGIDMDKGQSST
jgi:hypothetical protein